jgi:hypothetical protein
VIYCRCSFYWNCNQNRPGLEFTLSPCPTPILVSSLPDWILPRRETAQGETLVVREVKKRLRAAPMATLPTAFSLVRRCSLLLPSCYLFLMSLSTMAGICWAPETPPNNLWRPSPRRRCRCCDEIGWRWGEWRTIATSSGVPKICVCVLGIHHPSLSSFSSSLRWLLDFLRFSFSSSGSALSSLGSSVPFRARSFVWVWKQAYFYSWPK